MSTATLPARITEEESGISPEVLERVVVGGDLSKLTSEQKLQWYKARCDAAGLDPRTQPFQYLSLQGKLTLYATKTATDQLIASRKLTVEIIDRRLTPELGVFEVQCRVKFADGHHVEDFAALSVAGLKGEALCNAMMKGVTKAKRRTVLSACGLGMLDETEVETIPGAGAASEPLPRPQNNSGHATGQYASPAQVDAYRKATLEFCTDANARWADGWADSRGEIAADIGDILHPNQMTHHLLKWAIRTGRLAELPFTSDPETGKPTEKVSSEQAKKYVAIVFAREPEAVAEEAEEYFREVAQAAREAWYARHQPHAVAAREPGCDDE